MLIFAALLGCCTVAERLPVLDPVRSTSFEQRRRGRSSRGRSRPPARARGGSGGGGRGAYFANCAAARAAGAAPIRRGEAGYRAGLDRDNDGRACE